MSRICCSNNWIYKAKKKRHFSCALPLFLSATAGKRLCMMRPQCSALGTRLEIFLIHSGVILTLYRSNGCRKIGLWVLVAPSHRNLIEVLLMKSRIGLAVKNCNYMHLSNRCRKITIWVSGAPSHCNPIEVLLTKAKNCNYMHMVGVFATFDVPETQFADSNSVICC
ncbi:hypothetical protein AB205_0154710, partial [Aquarana catesbeiana]